MTRVNLLPEKSRLKLVQLGVLRQLKKYVFVVLTIFIIWSAGILAGDIYLSSQLGLISAKLNSVQIQINDFLPMINLQYQARHQIKNAATVLKERTAFSPLIGAVYTIIGEGAVPKSFKYEKGEILLEGFWPSISLLNEFEERLNQLDYQFQDIEFQLISAEQLSIEATGVNFSLKIKPKSGH